MLQTIVVVDDDSNVGNAVAMGIARRGRRVVVCRDVESASLVIDTDSVDAIVADIQFRGEFSFDGLDFLDELRREHRDLPIYLMTGASHAALENEARRRGANGFFRKPFSVDDLDATLPFPDDESSDEMQVTVPELDDLFDQELIHVSFQPIVNLVSQEHIGLEALARPVTDSLFRRPDLLFRYAASTERTVDLEAHCLRRAIETAAPLRKDKLLFLNVHPYSLESSAIVDAIEDSLRAGGIDPARLVIEITEHGALRSARGLDQIRSLKELGVAFAFDDIGSAFSHLPYIDEIGPSWMKISQVFGTGFESDATKQKIVTNIAALASSFDAKFILEGIETEETARAARALGIEYGQGYHFARPSVIDGFQYA